jgi:hypothetical protein
MSLLHTAEDGSAQPSNGMSICGIYAEAGWLLRRVPIVQSDRA